VSKKKNAVAGEEFLTEVQKLREYVMLALRSKGLDTAELKNLFGGSWLTKNRNYISELLDKKYILFKDYRG